MRVQTVVTITRISDDETDADEVWISATCSDDDDGDVYAADIVEVLGVIERGKYVLLQQN